MALSLVWWCRPATSALGRLRQGDYEFQASLSYRVRPCLKEPKVTLISCVHICGGGGAQALRTAAVHGHLSLCQAVLKSS